MLLALDSYEPLSIPFVLRLHRLLFSHSGGKGKWDAWLRCVADRGQLFFTYG
jgi:hypothetical protein